MRLVVFSLSLALAPISQLSAAGTSGGGFVAANDSQFLPGFDLDGGPIVSGSDLTPAVTFSVAMGSAFMTSKGITLGNGTLSPWGSSKNGAHRARSIIGSAPTGTGGAISTASAPTSSGSASSAPAVAVPEPGTFLTGLLLVGVCAGTRNRGSRRG